MVSSFLILKYSTILPHQLPVLCVPYIHRLEMFPEHSLALFMRILFGKIKILDMDLELAEKIAEAEEGLKEQVGCHGTPFAFVRLRLIWR